MSLSLSLGLSLPPAQGNGEGGAEQQGGRGGGGHTELWRCERKGLCAQRSALNQGCSYTSQELPPSTPRCLGKRSLTCRSPPAPAGFPWTATTPAGSAPPSSPAPAPCTPRTFTRREARILILKKKRTQLVSASVVVFSAHGSPVHSRGVPSRSLEKQNAATRRN